MNRFAISLPIADFVAISQREFSCDVADFTSL